jgi:hypothetical protein
MGAPWLLSFVIARKDTNVKISFDLENPDGHIILEMDDHSELMPMNGTYVDTELTQPFVRTVQVCAQWGDGIEEEKSTMILRRKDHNVNTYKVHKTEMKIVRKLQEDNDTIRSELSITKLTNNETKTAIIFLQRQKKK